MTELKGTNKNNPNTKKDIEVFVNKCSNQSYKTQSQTCHKLLIHRQIMKKE